MLSYDKELLTYVFPTSEEKANTDLVVAINELSKLVAKASFTVDQSSKPDTDKQLLKAQESVEDDLARGGLKKENISEELFERKVTEKIEDWNSKYDFKPSKFFKTEDGVICNYLNFAPNPKKPAENVQGKTHTHLIHKLRVIKGDKNEQQYLYPLKGQYYFYYFITTGNGIEIFQRKDGGTFKVMCEAYSCGKEKTKPVAKPDWLSGTICEECPHKPTKSQDEKVMGDCKRHKILPTFVLGERENGTLQWILVYLDIFGTLFNEIVNSENWKKKPRLAYISKLGKFKQITRKGKFFTDYGYPTPIVKTDDKDFFKSVALIHANLQRSFKNGFLPTQQNTEAKNTQVVMEPDEDIDTTGINEDDLENL